MGGLTATTLVQSGNALGAWDRDAANRLLLSAAFALVGAAVASRRAAPALGWTLVATGAAGALSVAGPRSLELVPLLLFALALALFPSGRLPSRAGRCCRPPRSARRWPPAWCRTGRCSRS